ncbi:XRE family transcriptional regulator [Nocardia yunnanensis]|uniref:XRE family transcriptional regulator n=1 Tax=Nocardia yunnanensis TaxID=2382165 RepID=A0A386ZHP4_9NOCA|nr:helix-turn-helix transcriptional regulator [Nocardia yunnanensis]AYF76910.1 XRE family transcriptional regulator [Nocardia yunnanensis]
MTGNELGEFLRACRAARRPEEAGLVPYGRRRVAGLRREEVAELARMNTDYYTRLEQGRERRPSPQLLEALGAVLGLSADVRDHMFRLAGVMPPAREPRPAEEVGPALRRMLESYPAAPALVLNPAMDILAANAPADAFFSGFARRDNLARMTFLDPIAPEFCVDWRWTCQAMVAGFRQAGALYPGDARLREVVGELLGASAEFAELWHSYALCVATAEPREFRHPEAGPLSLTYESFDVRGGSGQRLMVYHAEPGSPTAAALARLDGSARV